MMLPEVQHSAYTAMTRYGKSVLALDDLIAYLRTIPMTVRPGLVIIDPPGSMIRPALLHLDMLGLTPQILCDQLRERQKPLGRVILKGSNKAAAIDRDAENRIRIEECKALLLKSRGILDDSKTPMIKEALDLALNLFIKQKTPVPFTWLWKCFLPGSDVYRFLLGNCADADIVREFLSFERMSAANLEYRTGAARRILRDVCEMPAVKVRDGNPFDFESFLDSGGIYLEDGESRGDLSRAEQMFLHGHTILRVIQYARNRGKRRVICIVDEGITTGLLDMHIGRALAESAKWGLEWRLIWQNSLALQPETREAIEGNISRWFIGRQVSPAAIKHMAEFIALRQLDPYRVHSVETRKRQLHDGVTYETRKSKGSWRSGEQAGSSSGESEFAVPQYRNIEERSTRYFSLQDQILLIEKLLATAGVGEFFRLDGQYVSQNLERHTMLEIPWSCFPSLPAKKCQQILERILSRPEYRVPTLRQPPCPPQPEPSQPRRETVAERWRRIGMQ